MNGDIREWTDSKSYPPAGLSDSHWVSVCEVLAVIGSGLLDDFCPLIFDPDEEESGDGETFEDVGLIRVDLPWWYPPSPEGPAFGYPACLFLRERCVRRAGYANGPCRLRPWLESEAARLMRRYARS